MIYDEERVMHSKCDNIENKINNRVDEFLEKLFQSLFSRCQFVLETSMKGGDWIFDCVHIELQMA